jgi:hypothetical protein
MVWCFRNLTRNGASHKQERVTKWILLIVIDKSWGPSQLLCFQLENWLLPVGPPQSPSWLWLISPGVNTGWRHAIWLVLFLSELSRQESWKCSYLNSKTAEVLVFCFRRCCWISWWLSISLNSTRATNVSRLSLFLTIQFLDPSTSAQGSRGPGNAWHSAY